MSFIYNNHLILNANFTKNHGKHNYHSNITEWRLTMKKDLYSHLKKLPYIDTSITFFSAHKQYVSCNWKGYPSSHTAFEILLILSGEQESIIDQHVYILKENDILLVPPGILHENRCFSNQGMTYFVAHFDIDDPALRYSMIKNGRLIYPHNTSENSSLRLILNEWIFLYDKKNTYSLSDRFLSLEILSRLMTTLAKISEENKGDKGDKGNMQALSIARSIAETIQHNFNSFFLNENRDKNLLLIKNIYREINISMSYGLEVFKEIYGISPKEYLDRLKFKESKRLIRNPNISIEFISEQVGYSNVSHFSRQFKKWAGVSPKIYRQNMLPFDPTF